MVKEQILVRLVDGLQARPAALFVQEANRYNAEIFVEKGERKANAKSIMGMMSLALGQGAEITLTAEGEDEGEALASLVAFLSNETF